MYFAKLFLLYVKENLLYKIKHLVYRKTCYKNVTSVDNIIRFCPISIMYIGSQICDVGEIVEGV